MIERSTDEILESEAERLKSGAELSQAVSDSIEREARRYPKELDGGLYDE